MLSQKTEVQKLAVEKKQSASASSDDILLWFLVPEAVLVIC